MTAAPPVHARFVPELAYEEKAEAKYGSFKAYWGNCLDAQEVIEQSSVSLVVTSPPYPGVERPQEEYATFDDPTDFNGFHGFLDEVWLTCYNLLADQGRLAINIYDIPRGEIGMVPNVTRVVVGCLQVGFVLRETYIWDKGSSYSPPSGSFPLPKGVLSGNTYEPILVFQKPLQFSQRRIDPKSYPEDVKNASLLDSTAGDWLRNPIWKIPADREARKIGHPFPFPMQIPERLIKLYTMVGDTVYDPFGGAGTTGIVAKKLGREGIITELSTDYIQMINNRTAQGSLL